MRPAGGRHANRQNPIFWKRLSVCVCVALTERSDKTSHTNWVLQQPQSHNALSLPRGQSVWLFLCSYRGFTASVCLYHMRCVSTTPPPARLRRSESAGCVGAIRDSGGGKEESTSSVVCSHGAVSVHPNGSPLSRLLGLDMTISNVIVSR